MSDAMMTKRPRWSDWALILAVFAAAVFGAASLGRVGTRPTNVSAATVITAGTVAIALMSRRFSLLPRWATLVGVGILGISAIAGAALWPESAAWHRAVKDSLWMHPWFFLTFTGIAGPTGSCACDPGSRIFSWIFIGMAFFIGVIVPAIAVLV